MSSLSEITGLPDEVLRDPLNLQPRQRFAADQPDNLVFLCPSILTDDSLLRFGGTDGMGAKECLSQVTKKILSPPKDISLFEVPELTCTHMGYGKKSKNKEGKPAITKEEGEYWMDALDFGRFERAEPEGVDITPEDVETFSSGLKIEGKGRLHLLFSILLIFFDKKSPKEEREAKVGPNKVSDFLVFWILPYLMNFSHRKVQEIIAHGKRLRECYSIKTVKTSAKAVIKNACKQMLDRHCDHLLSTFRDIFRSSEPIEEEYDLLDDSSGSPIIFIPMKYQITRMPVKIADCGSKETWRKLGKVSLREEFLQKIVQNREIQKDFFHALSSLPDRQGIDFGVIFPDRATFEHFINNVRNTRPGSFYKQEPKPIQCRGVTAERVLVESAKRNLTVCFSYLQGIDNTTIAQLFRAIGSHYLNHFTILILHGKVCNAKDPDYCLGNLHPVAKATKFEMQAGRMKKSSRKKYPLKFINGRGLFTSMEFPVTYSRWEEELKSELVIRAKTLEPKYKFDEPVCVAFFNKSISRRSASLPLRAVCLANNKNKVKFHEYRVVNMDGCAIVRISESARKNGHALIMALGGYPDKFECKMAHRPIIMHTIIDHFVGGLIVAGLHLVFDPVPDKEDHEVLSGSEGEEEEEEEEEEGDSGHQEDSGCLSEATQVHWVQPRKVKHGKGLLHDSSKVKVGKDPKSMPSPTELDLLSKEITDCWESLGRQLGLTSKIDCIRNSNVSFPNADNKAYQMLEGWHDKGSASTYGQLREALMNIGKIGLAKQFC